MLVAWTRGHRHRDRRGRRGRPPRGAPVTDADGTRTASVVFPAGTKAEMVLPDGSTRPLDAARRAGDGVHRRRPGAEAMPGTLPATSAYTYAVELSVDQAVAAGATQVSFDRPVVNYSDNFLGFPVGSAVPDGLLRPRSGPVEGRRQRARDRDHRHRRRTRARRHRRRRRRRRRPRHRARPSARAAGGAARRRRRAVARRADPLHPVGLQLALRPAPGRRVPRPARPARRTRRPTAAPASAPRRARSSAVRASAGRGAAAHRHAVQAALRLPPCRPPDGPDGDDPADRRRIPDSLEEVRLEIMVAGQKSVQTFAPRRNLTHEFVWDRKDAYGREIQGRMPVYARIGFVYGIRRYADTATQLRAFGRFTSEVFERRRSWAGRGRRPQLRRLARVPRRVRGRRRLLRHARDRPGRLGARRPPRLRPAQPDAVPRRRAAS